MYKRIFISGASGSGKTTLAKYISNAYSIPFIDGSSKVLWPKYGIKSHLDLINKCKESKEFAITFQYRLLSYRQEAIKDLDSFVTDRSPLDNLVYFMLQLSHDIVESENVKYIEECSKTFQYGENLLFITKIADNPIEDDGMRITNYFYQRMVQGLFENMITENWLELDYDTPVYNLDWDWDERIKKVRSIIWQ